ncbi:unnamed protein product [Trifolium pratense]|uniref:Uncharacterized protein n=1 Tax=Trifolium pratense TaxID=57577 RepID=A0ACB0JUC9_TRIPR|nr:unnamed protein product [Trifolium pratense]
MAMYHHYYSSSQYNEKEIGEQLCYIPHDALQNLEWYPTFSETMEKSLQEDLNYLLFCDTQEKETLKFNQLGEGIPQENMSNVQINQEGNTDTSLANIHIKNHENLPKNNVKSQSKEKGLKVKKSKDKGLKAKKIDNYKERICSHCKTKDTTQWRNGPLGRNTLCNACGLRFKSNRLMEGYKPRASSNLDMIKEFRFSQEI